MQTTVAVIESPGADFTFAEVDLEGPREDEVLVRVVATGLCHTDVTMKSMLPAEMLPKVFGHEGTGVVEQVGSAVAGISVGDHVVMSFDACRSCAACNEGRVGYCENTLMLNYMGFRMDGSTTYTREGQPVYGTFFGQSSFSKHAIAKASNCVVVSPDLDLAKVAPYGCGFQTGAGTVLNLLQPAPSESLVVFGVGAVGLAAIAAARATGVETVIAVDLKDSRLEVAASFGATPLNPTGLDAAEVPLKIKELTGGAGAAYAIDTTGLSVVVKQAQQSTRVGATIVALGLNQPEYTIDAIDLLQNGKVLRSSIEGESDPLTMVPRLLQMNADGDFPVDDLVTTYPFEQINQAVHDLESGAVVKAVLVW